MPVALRRGRTGGGLNKTSIQLSDDDLAAVDRDAEEEGLSRSAMITRLIRRGHEAREEDVKMAEEIKSIRNRKIEA